MTVYQLYLVLGDKLQWEYCLTCASYLHVNLTFYSDSYNTYYISVDYAKKKTELIRFKMHTEHT